MSAKEARAASEEAEFVPMRRELKRYLFEPYNLVGIGSRVRPDEEGTET